MFTALFIQTFSYKKAVPRTRCERVGGAVSCENDRGDTVGVNLN